MSGGIDWAQTEASFVGRGRLAAVGGKWQRQWIWGMTDNGAAEKGV